MLPSSKAKLSWTLAGQLLLLPNLTRSHHRSIATSKRRSHPHRSLNPRQCVIMDPIPSFPGSSFHPSLETLKLLRNKIIIFVIILWFNSSFLSWSIIQLWSRLIVLKFRVKQVCTVRGIVLYSHCTGVHSSVGGKGMREMERGRNTSLLSGPVQYQTPVWKHLKIIFSYKNIWSVTTVKSDMVIWYGDTVWLNFKNAWQIKVLVKIVIVLMIMLII